MLDVVVSSGRSQLTGNLTRTWSLLATVIPRKIGLCVSPELIPVLIKNTQGSENRYILHKDKNSNVTTSLCSMVVCAYFLASYVLIICLWYLFVDMLATYLFVDPRLHVFDKPLGNLAT